MVRMEDLKRIELLKTPELYFILEEFHNHMDENGNFLLVDRDDIFKSLMKKGKMKEKDFPDFKRLCISVSAGVDILYHKNGPMYKLTDLGHIAYSKWKYDFDTKGSLSHQEQIKIQDAIIKIRDSYQDSYYNIRVFISHSSDDIQIIEKICENLIKQKIKPILWFEEIKDESVKMKLCKMIDSVDLCLIVLSSQSLKSQMTNNEIGFIEGRRFYNFKFKGINNPFVLRVCDKTFQFGHLSGFITRADDILTVDYSSNKDYEKISLSIKNIIKRQSEQKTNGKLSIDDLLKFSTLLTLQKLAKDAKINKYQPKEKLIGEIIRSEYYSLDDLLNKMTANQLKKICKKHSISQNGSKSELEKRVKNLII